MRDFISLLQKIAAQSVNEGLKPVSVQTGIMENEEEVRLDQTITVKPTLPGIYSEGLKFQVEGELNGEQVSGELNLKISLQSGDIVKIIKEDGTNKYFVISQLTL